MTRSTPESRRPRQLPWLLVILAAAIGLTGYYGPWVAHRAAGLTVIGLDLAEFVKFLPNMSSGQTAIQREVFYLPLLAGSLTLAWWPAGAASHLAAVDTRHCGCSVCARDASSSMESRLLLQRNSVSRSSP